MEYVLRFTVWKISEKKIELLTTLLGPLGHGKTWPVSMPGNINMIYKRLYFGLAMIVIMI